MDAPRQEPRRGFFSSRAGWVFSAFAAIALFFLIAEHRAHLGFLVPYVPLALIGVCVVLHAYMHGVVHGPGPGNHPPGESESGHHDRHHHS